MGPCRPSVAAYKGGTAFGTTAWLEAISPVLSGVEVTQGKVGEEEEAVSEEETDIQN